ncbi:MAG: acyltransferase, partial [Bacteroidales bacterium]|nr:acyltransferase [Bacteroidales bacterium]
ELIAMNGDRFLAGNLTVSCNFLGHDAKFPLSPYYIAGKYNVPVVYAFAMKEGKNFYRFFATPKRYIENFYSMKKREQGLKDAVNDYAAALEKIVCKYPLQWFNYYNFWSKTE